jgi:hypothetical protein
MSWYRNKITSPFEQLDPAQALACAREFIKAPTHRPASDDLQLILNRLHGMPLEGRYVLFQRKAWKSWCVARLNGRGIPVTLYEDQQFSSLEDGERAIFRLRWKEETGTELPF